MNKENKKSNKLAQLRFIRIVLFLLMIFFFLLIFSQTLYLPYKPKKLSYSQFLKLVKEGKVTEVSISENDIKGKLKVLIKGGKLVEYPFTSYIPYPDPELIKLLMDNNVEISGEVSTRSKWWVNLLYSAIIPVGIIFFIFWLLSRHAKTGPARFLSFGQSKAKLFTQDDKHKITFQDVAGVEEAKEELKEIVEFLKNPKRFQKLGAKIPKGILLMGPPGTGKTLLAKAVAGEAGVKFLSISGSDFVEMFVGVGASRVRDLFDQGKKMAPCIIFIDEIDAVGRQRGAGLGGGHDEREQTLNQLLVEMDGFNTQEGVILVAATNRPDVLDPALLRPGRFDRHIVVDVPDLRGREEILKVHIRDKILADDVDINVLARRTPGFVGSDIANLVNEAALLAARKGKDKITMEDFEEAIDRVIAGPQRKSRLISEKEKKIVAYHESGHALVAYFLEHTDPIHKISIMPRGYGALGYTLQLPLEDKYLTTKAEVIDRVTTLLGGRVAEEEVFGEITTGAQNDIERATEMVRMMVCEYGMSESLGPLTFGRKHKNVFLGRDIVEERNFSEEIASKIDKEICKIIQECYKRAKDLIKKYKDKLDKLAQALIEKELLESEEIERILKE